MKLTRYFSPVSTLIFKAVETRTSVLYSALFAIFPDDTPPADVYDTLEAVCTELADPRQAIYTVVVTKKATGLPGDGFFDMFRTFRHDEYVNIAGRSSTLELTNDQKHQIVALEQLRVYADAGA